MKAAVVRAFGEPDVLLFEDLRELEPAAGEIVIDVEAVAVNFVDLLVISGKYQFLPPIPFTPGKLPVGRVAKIGPGVEDFRIGDRVLATAEDGGYAQQARAAAKHCYRIPDEMSFVDAASLALAFDTAWFALHERARLLASESVLVLGASGGVGIAAVQLAKALGARVLASVSSPDKAEAVRSAGADAVIDLSVANIRDALKAQVLAANNGALVDVIIDPLGDQYFQAALRALAWCGRLVVIGFAAGDIPTLKANYLLVKNIAVMGLQVSDYRKRRPDLMARCFAEVFDLFRQGRIRAPNSATFPLERAAEALVQVRDRTAPARLVLTPRS